VAKLRKSFAEDKRAVSAVIATVIIVAVTIAIAIAVAYWMGGLATIFTRFEKIEVKSAFVQKSSGQFIITITYINTGATATTVDLVTINGVPCESYVNGTVTRGGSLTEGGDELTCPTGVERVGTLTFPDGVTDPSGNMLTGGVTATVDLHTTGGKDYYNSVTLP